MRAYFKTVIGFLLLAAPAAADDAKAPANIAQLDRQLAEIFKQGNIPGASVALIENGQVTFVKAYGYADTAKKIPATPDTVFRAGSISKSFTSIAVMTAVEQGRISLDAKLADVAPEVKFVNPWEASNPVRLANLLEHTTGWPDVSLRVYMTDGKGWSVLRGVQATSSEFVSRWKPGYFPVYNNAGPAVAAVMLEKATGQVFAAYMRDHVLRPMGMASADFDNPPALAARISRSYEPDGKETPFQYIILPPAGSLATTPRELAQLVRFYLGRGTVDGHQVLKPASVARIERSETTLASRFGFTNGYGLGNTPLPDKGITFRGHNGSIDSFTSVYSYLAACNCGYVLMANGGEGVNFATPVSALVQNYLTRNMTAKYPAPYRIADEELARYDGYYRTITPPNNLLRPFAEAFGLTRVSVAHGQLRSSGNAFIPTGPHSFRRFDRDQESLSFVEEDGQVYKISAFNAQVREPMWRVALIFSVYGFLVLGLIVSVAMIFVWIVQAIRGRIGAGRGLLMPLWPLASILALAGTVALPLMQISAPGTAGLHKLAEIGPYSLSIMACSILFPLFAALGLLAAIRNADARLIARLYVGATSLALLAVTGYAASIGWVGLRTWTM